jgi:uncharacterized OB-fold protein
MCTGNLGAPEVDSMDLKTPRVNDRNRPYFEALEEGRLTTTYCERCEEITGFPPRVRCPRCLGADLSWADLSLRGDIYSHSRVWVSAAQFAHDLPYYICLVDLDDGPRIAGRLNWGGDGEPEIGAAVEVRFGLEDLPYYFAPAAATRDGDRGNNGS